MILDRDEKENSVDERGRGKREEKRELKRNINRNV